MLSFSVEAAQDELGLLIKKGQSILHMHRQSVPQVEIVLRAEANWLRESYDTLALVFQKKSQATSKTPKAESSASGKALVCETAITPQKPPLLFSPSP